MPHNVTSRPKGHATLCRVAGVASCHGETFCGQHRDLREHAPRQPFSRGGARLPVSSPLPSTGRRAHSRELACIQLDRHKAPGRSPSFKSVDTELLVAAPSFKSIGATLPSGLFHSNGTTRTLPEAIFHSSRTTRTLPDAIFHSNRRTRTLPETISSFESKDANLAGKRFFTRTERREPCRKRFFIRIEGRDDPRGTLGVSLQENANQALALLETRRRASHPRRNWTVQRMRTLTGRPSFTAGENR